MKTRTYVEGKITVPGFHCWPTAPVEFGYLKHQHRHLFVIRLRGYVSEFDREIEFIDLGDSVRSFLLRSFKCNDGVFQFASLSCEEIARRILHAFQPEAFFCSVYEDDENGAAIEREESNVSQMIITRRSE